jgi:hypothetical protein
MTEVLSKLKGMRKDMDGLRTNVTALLDQVSSKTPGKVKEVDLAAVPDPASQERSGDVVMADALHSGESPDMHSTGAHNLFQWPRINEFYRSAGINNKNYLDDLGKEQGVLRLYSFGNARNQGVMAPPNSTIYQCSTIYQ